MRRETPFRRNKLCFLRTSESAEPQACSKGKTDMSVTPEHYRAARPALPRLPLPALLVFAVSSFGGALFLAYSTFSSSETTHSLASVSAAPVYEARAVPQDLRPEEAAARATAVARAIMATQSESQRSERPRPCHRGGKGIVRRALDRDQRRTEGLHRFAGASTGNNYLALTGATFGMSAQLAPSGFFAPDAETIISAPVPEASTWLCGAALLALVVAARSARQLASASAAQREQE